MPSVNAETTEQAYWRSLEELADAPEFRRFLEAEFPGSAADLLSSASRRQFLKLMGASLGLAGMVGCRWPVERIAPYANRPVGRLPGRPVRYATARELAGVAAGLLVTSSDGRPIKVEGNPSHPSNRGAADSFSQASILELYDPDRSRSLIQGQGGQSFRRTWEEFAVFAAAHFGALREQGGAGFCVLSEASSSPSLAEMRARLVEAFPRSRWYEYEPLSRDNERVGTGLAFGSPYRPHPTLDRAETIVCLDADPLMTHPAAVQYARDFATGRRVDERGRREDSGGPMNRLLVVESHHSVTGSSADHRWAVPSGAIPAVACRLAAELAGTGLEIPGLSPQTIASFGRAELGFPINAQALATMARELAARRGRGVVAAGPQQPPEVHALVCAINEALGNVGRTVFYMPVPDPERPTHIEAIKALAAEIRKGEVGTLLILGGNPAYDAPADLECQELLGSVGTTIHLSLYRNETSLACGWHLPRAHYLESWGDARAYDGTLSLIQPLIEPLYGGRTPIEVLALVLGEPPLKGYDIVRRTLRQMRGESGFEAFWMKSLHDGVVPGTAWPVEEPRVRRADWVGALRDAARYGAGAGAETFEVVFRQDHRVYDGRFANNGWLQEMPDPMTKLTWDNAALFAPATAEALGIETGELVKLGSNGRELEISAFVLPGQAAGSVTVPLGYGRRAAGRVGDGRGFDGYALRTSDAPDILSGVQITRTGRGYKLAVTQDHHAIASAAGRESARARVPVLVREANLDEYVRHPDFARHIVHSPPLVSLWREKQYTGRRWAMSVDLNACVGCGACVVACQAENNVPVVGKDEVERGREMHWLRVDRYFKGPPQAPQVVHQPLPCQQCQNAPCEQVCPVAATVHSGEGLNDMVYNRCIGTRYCSNNCPYKVRRFNWFNNHRDLAEIEKMKFNPEVTVRARGVMEKCTYCIQRISAVRIAAKNERRPVADGEIVPACAQTCPTQAIVFGDLSDANSRVSKLHARDRSYAMLSELNVKPRTRYLAKLRNPAAGLSDRAAPREEGKP